MKPNKLKLIIVILVLLLGVAMVVTAAVLKKNNGNSVDSLSKSVKATTVTDPYGRYAFEIPAGYELVDMETDETVLKALPLADQKRIKAFEDSYQLYVLKKGNKYLLVDATYGKLDHIDNFIYTCGDTAYRYTVATDSWDYRYLNNKTYEHGRELINCDFPTAKITPEHLTLLPSEDYFLQPVDSFDLIRVGLQNNKYLGLIIKELVFGTWSYNSLSIDPNNSEYSIPPEPGTTTLAPLLNDYQDLFKTIESTIRWLD